MSQALQLPPSGVLMLAADGTLAQPWRTFFLALISRAGGILGGFQPASLNLDALAAFNAAAGVLVQTGLNTFTKRTLTGTASRIVVLNGTGAAGNPTVDLAPVAGVAGVHASPTSITVDAYGRITAITP